MSDPIQPPTGYKSEPPTEEGWYRIAGYHHGMYHYRCLRVEYTPNGELGYWSDSGSRWRPLSWVGEWWGTRVEFP